MATTLDLLRAKEAELAAEVERLETAQAELQAVRVALRSLDLSRPGHSDTVDAMDAMTIGEIERRAGAQLDLRLPFSKVAKKLGLTLVELAAELREDYSNVRNWNSRKKMPPDVQAKLDILKRRPKKRPAKPAK